ncbi:MAG: T9SS type A sorting domain-containing protein [Chitinophagales bacterium]
MKKLYSMLVALVIVLSANLSFAQNHATILLESGPCDPIIPILCPSGVVNPNLAVDNDISTFATMKTTIGIASSSYLKMGFSTPAPSGYTVGIFLDESVVLDVNVLATITLKLYNSADQVIKTKTGLTVADVQIDDQNRGIAKIKVPSGKSAASVKITLGGLLLLNNNVNVYGATYAPNSIAVYADYVFAEGPCDPIVPIICPGGVLNSGRAVDANLNNYATLTIPLGVGGTAFLDLGFTNEGPAGASVYYTLGNTGILDITLLENLKLTVYDENGNVVKEKNNFTLADATILGSNKFRIRVKTPAGTYHIARARITLTSLVSVLSEVRVYNSYYKGKVNFASYFRTEQSAIALSDDVNVYPNPASDLLNVYLSNDFLTRADIEIVNLIGQTVYIGKAESGNNEINIARYDNGLYSLRISQDGEFTSKKFVVQR